MAHIEDYQREIFTADTPRWRYENGSLYLYRILTDDAFMRVKNHGLRRVFRDPRVRIGIEDTETRIPAYGPWLPRHLVTSWMEGPKLVVCIQMDEDDMPPVLHLDLKWRGHGSRDVSMVIRRKGKTKQ